MVAPALRHETHEGWRQLHPAGPHSPQGTSALLFPKHDRRNYVCNRCARARRKNDEGITGNRLVYFKSGRGEGEGGCGTFCANLHIDAKFICAQSQSKNRMFSFLFHILIYKCFYIYHTQYKP